MNGSVQLVQKLWNYCNILRDDGLSYGDFAEQLTFLLFLKMAEEQTRPPFNKPSPIPKQFGWDKLVKLHGDELETQYRHTLEGLGTRPGLLGLIFSKAQNKIQDPAKLRRLVVDLIDREEWSSLDTDVKGGAGQYFTPRPLIHAIVDVIQPRSEQAICDPACGTGGFLLAAHDFIRHHNQLNKAQLRQLNIEALRGVELVDGVARLCAMNLLLHGIGGDSDAPVPILVKDALAAKVSKLKLRSTILDGEVVAVDENGIPRFQLLQRFQKQPTAPTLYYVFDVLWHNGYDLTGKPLLERKSVLERILKPKPGCSAWELCRSRREGPLCN
jgi:type I restriction enzyme M protein